VYGGHECFVVLRGVEIHRNFARLHRHISKGTSPEGLCDFTNTVREGMFHPGQQTAAIHGKERFQMSIKCFRDCALIILGRLQQPGRQPEIYAWNVTGHHKIQIMQCGRERGGNACKRPLAGRRIQHHRHVEKRQVFRIIRGDHYFLETAPQAFSNMLDERTTVNEKKPLVLSHS